MVHIHVQGHVGKDRYLFRPFSMYQPNAVNGLGRLPLALKLQYLLYPGIRMNVHFNSQKPSILEAVPSQ
jgi:hypothetical protein